MRIDARALLALAAFVRLHVFDEGEFGCSDAWLSRVRIRCDEATEA